MSTQPEALRLADAMSLSFPGNLGIDKAAAKLRRLAAVEAQRALLLEALKKAVENGCATVYANEDDECGERGCCGVVSYKPHADDCWVTTARAAIKAMEGENT